MFDIALIEMEEDLEINERVKPICIHSKNFNYLLNDLKNQRENQRNYKRQAKGQLSFTKRFNDLFGDLLGTSVLAGGDLINNMSEEIKNNSEKIRSKIENKKLRSSPKNLHFEMPTDKTPIILEHPDKHLVEQVIKMGEQYHQQIQNDPVKIFDPAKEFTDKKLPVIGWGLIDRYKPILTDVLMEAEIKQKPSEMCENTYGDDVFFR